MNGKRINVALVPSSAMEKAGEHEMVRIPKKVRTTAAFRRKFVSVLGRRLKIHQALTKDIDRVKKQKKLKYIPIVGFVSTSVFSKICAGKKKETEGWISEASEPLKIGCDPEFVLIEKETNKYFYAGNGYSSTTPSAGISHNGEFGSDGPCAEIRPKEDTDIEELVGRIDSILKDNKGHAEKFLWRGGSTYKTPEKTYSIGGHISLGRIEQVKNEQTQDVYKTICKILNNTVGVPLYRIEMPDPWKRRDGFHEGPFGTYNDFRCHNDTSRMEWRVPGGYWLIHPDLTRTVLATAKAVTEAIYHLYAEEGYDLGFLTGEVPGIYKVVPEIQGTLELAVGVLNSKEPVKVSVGDSDKCLKALTTLCIRGNTRDDYRKHLAKFRSMTRRGVECSLLLNENWLEGKKLKVK